MVASELQRVARALVDTLDQTPEIVGLLQQTASGLRRQAAYVATAARDDPRARACALRLDHAARSCDHAAAFASRAAPEGRAWAHTKAGANAAAAPGRAGASAVVETSNDDRGNGTDGVTGEEGDVLALSSEDPDHRQALTSPPPNATIVVDGRFTYRTDEHGRVVRASTTLDTVDLDHPRDEGAQRQLLGKVDGDHAGHIFARIFQGPAATVNLTPMEGRKVNQGQYKTLENEWRNLIESGKTVEVVVGLEYRSSSSRPSAFVVEYNEPGQPAEQIRIKNAPRSEDG